MVTENQPLAAGHLSPALLHLVVMPTEQCNLRCVYCYEDFAPGRMPPPVVHGLKRFLNSRAPELNQLWIAWFGGEPLLAFDIVADIQAHIQALSRRHEQLSSSASMTTNAFLLNRRRLERLLALGVREYQITLDGPRELHDRKRIRPGGGGTFDRIWGNLLAAREVKGEFAVLIRLHIDRDNHQALDQFIDDYQRHFGGDPRFRLFPRPLSRLGSPRDASLPVFEADESEHIVHRIRTRAHDRGLTCYSIEKADHACYAARANSFVIRADGHLAKCTVAFSDPDNCVGWLRPDGRVEIDSRKMAIWMRGLFSHNEEELACPLRGYKAFRDRMDPRPLVWWHRAG